MTALFTAVEAFDVRFPTSREFHGSDAMHPDPDYSAAYVIVRTDAPDGLAGHGFAFTIGRGNDVEIAAIRALEPLIVGKSVDQTVADMGAFWLRLCGDTQLRWLGPDKGVMHMAVAAIVNAVWDLYAKRMRMPLWRLLSSMLPEQIVALVDFRYLTDAITPQEALGLLRANEATKPQRELEVAREGYPAYTTSAGWLGHRDDVLAELCKKAVTEGWTHLKIKVGRDIDEDVRRCRIAREAIGPHRKLMLDANQSWSVSKAKENMARLAQFDPYWIEEPTHPDDVLGLAAIARAVAPITVAAGEHVPNSIVFKQLLQSKAIGVCQIDACRSGGLNDVIATLLMAAKFGIPVCPHAGGVGLCEVVQHISMFDYVAVSASMERRAIEFVDHLHEHFEDPVHVSHGRYSAPLKPGFSSTMYPQSLERYAFPGGVEWKGGVASVL